MIAAAPTTPESRDVSILQTAVPFGPFLSLAAGIYALFQPELIALVVLITA